MKIFRERGFTLTEILIVSIIVAIVAGFVVPSYKNYSEQSKEKLGWDNLKLIGQAINRYKTQNDNYPAGILDLATINSTLGISLMPGALTYTCTNTATSYDCSAASSSWSIHISSTHPTLVHCSSGVCPKCSSNEAINCPY